MDDEEAEQVATSEEGEVEEEEEATEAEEAEEEEKAVGVKEEEKEEEIAEERIYTIPLRRAWISPRTKRTPKTVRLIKGFIQRHMKPEAIVISNEVNERVWKRGIEKPPRRIRVRAVKNKEGVVKLYLAEGD